MAVEKENLEIIKLLLSNDKVDINIPSIFIKILFMKFKNQIFKIHLKIYMFQWNLIPYILITFNLKDL